MSLMKSELSVMGIHQMRDMNDLLARLCIIGLPGMCLPVVYIRLYVRFDTDCIVRILYVNHCNWTHVLRVRGRYFSAYDACF